MTTHNGKQEIRQAIDKADYLDNTFVNNILKFYPEPYVVKSWFSKADINNSQQFIYCDDACVKAMIENRYLKQLNYINNTNFKCVVKN